MSTTHSAYLAVGFLINHADLQAAFPNHDDPFGALNAKLPSGTRLEVRAKDYSASNEPQNLIVCLTQGPSRVPETSTSHGHCETGNVILLSVLHDALAGLYRLQSVLIALGLHPSDPIVAPCISSG